METAGPPAAPGQPGQPGQPGPVLGLRSLSFAYQGLLEIPYEVILAQQHTLEVLDLSYNLLEEYPSALSPVETEANTHTLHTHTSEFHLSLSRTNQRHAMHVYYTINTQSTWQCLSFIQLPTEPSSPG